MPPVTGRRLESLLAILGSRDVADFLVEVVIEAAGTARRIDDGTVVLTAFGRPSVEAGWTGELVASVPLRARGAIVRDRENIFVEVFMSSRSRKDCLGGENARE